MKYNIERKEKLIRIWITMIRHGSLGHQVQESWPYLLNVTPSPYGPSHVKNEFFLMRLTACQCENGQSEREGVEKHQWVQI